MIQRKTFTLRLENELLEKVHYIADLNKRSVNNQIEFLLEKFIAEFEKEEGEILLPKVD